MGLRVEGLAQPPLPLGAAPTNLEGGLRQPPSPLYKVGRAGAGRTPHQTLAAPSLQLPPPLLRRLGEALQVFSSTTTTTPSCCWDSRRIYHIHCPAGTGRGRRHRQPYVCPSTEVLPVCGTEGIVHAILRSASD